MKCASRMKSLHLVPVPGPKYGGRGNVSVRLGIRPFPHTLWSHRRQPGIGILAHSLPCGWVPTDVLCNGIGKRGNFTMRLYWKVLLSY